MEDILTVNVGRLAATEVEADSATVELSSFNTFWASSARAAPKKKAAAQAMVAGLNFIVKFVGCCCDVRLGKEP